MKFYFLFFILFLPFVLAENLTENITNESSINESMINITINETIELNETVNFSFENETIIENFSEVIENNFTEINESPNESLVYGIFSNILNYEIMNFLEGSIYLVDFYENFILLDVVEGEIFSGKSYANSFFGPIIDVEGETFNVYLGGSGNFITPYSVASSVISLYCGDGTCNNGENCDTCSIDCGECSNEGNSRGTSYCAEGYEEINETCVKIEIFNQTQTETYDFFFEPKLTDLFFENGKDLIIVVSYNLTNPPVPINLSFEIYDTNENLLKQKSGYDTINYNRTIQYNFNDLNLFIGEYEFRLIVFSEYKKFTIRQKFIVDSENLIIKKGTPSTTITGNVIGWLGEKNNKFYLIFGIVLVVLIGVFFRIKYLRAKKHKRFGF